MDTQALCYNHTVTPHRLQGSRISSYASDCFDSFLSRPVTWMWRIIPPMSVKANSFLVNGSVNVKLGQCIIQQRKTVQMNERGVSAAPFPFSETYIRCVVWRCRDFDRGCRSFIWANHETEAKEQLGVHQIPTSPKTPTNVAFHSNKTESQSTGLSASENHFTRSERRTVGNALSPSQDSGRAKESYDDDSSVVYCRARSG